MTPATIALGVLAATLAVVLGLALQARGARTLEQWSIAGRGFGTLLIFLLFAGEIYSTFTFLGASGLAYGQGAPAFYILAYAPVAYILSYWLLPVIWQRAATWHSVSQPEFFASAYRSAAFGRLIAGISIAAMIPYLVLQLRGLGIIVREISYGAISANTAIVIGTCAMVTYVVIAGLRGSARAAMLKNVLVLAVVLGLGIALPITLFGSHGALFDRLIAERPTYFLFEAEGRSGSWYASTVLLTACGFYLWPHTFQSVFSARDGDTFRRNAAIMPLYQIILLFVFFVGFTAALHVPGLEGSDVDQALLRVTRAVYGPWIVGTVGAAGMLTALVPGSILLMTCATIVARLLVPNAALDPGRDVRMARRLVPVIALVALWFTFRGGETLVTLLLFAYSIVTQLFPALLVALVWPARAHAPSAVAGLLVGEGIVVGTGLAEITVPALLPTWPHAITDIHIGLFALIINACVLLTGTFIVSARNTRATTAYDHR
jgi:solute:Na+ symporter, SSS family